jgi:hypothetical protein
MDATNLTTNLTPSATAPSAAQTMSPARQGAYRRFALTVLGLDVPTLAVELRARRLAAAPRLQIVPTSSSSSSRAA